MVEGKDIGKRISDDLKLFYTAAREHGLDIYAELAQKNPEEAARKFTESMDKVLDSSGGFFRGRGCGGPDYVMGSKVINILGSVYPTLPKNLREIAFGKVLRYLDGLNYFNSQNHLERVHEPHMLRDVIVNRPLYSPGFQLYSDAVKISADWGEFEENIMKLMEIDSNKGVWIPSQGMLGFALSLKNFTKPEVLRGFAEQFPEVCERTKDFDAGVVALQGAYCESKTRKDKNFEGPKSFGAGIESKLAEFVPQWQDEIYEKVKEGEWIWSNMDDRTAEYNKLYAEWKGKHRS